MKGNPGKREANQAPKEQKLTLAYNKAKKLQKQVPKTSCHTWTIVQIIKNNL